MLLAFRKLAFGLAAIPNTRKHNYEYDSLKHSSSNTDYGDGNSQFASMSLHKQTGKRINARVISDATIGLSDGLTVPFALTAGLSAFGSTRVVIYGGLAELIAGAISMGIGGYLGAKTEAASYESQRSETKRHIAADYGFIGLEISKVLQEYKLPAHTVEEITKHIARSPHAVDFVMQFVNRAEEPTASRAFVSAVTIAMGYFLGGLLPLLPYFFVDHNSVYTALYTSIGITVITLFLFGYVKTCIVTGWHGARCIQRGCFGGMQMVVVGGFAAASAMGLVRLFNQDELGLNRLVI